MSEAIVVAVQYKVRYYIIMCCEPAGSFSSANRGGALCAFV
jgi:hypothetical protein